MVTLTESALARRAEATLVRRLLALPARAQRILAGPVVVRDEQELEVETQLLLRLQALAGRGAVGLRPQARTALDRDAAMVGGTPPIGEVRRLQVDGAEGELDARLYVPQTLVRSAGRDPLLVFFHGGGWVIGSLDSHDATCRVLAERAGVRVLSVGYRLAPEHAFPAPVDDAFVAYRWVVANAAQLGADPSRLAVGGDSAGGNLAAVTAIQAAEQGMPLAFQLLIYPATDLQNRSPSREKFAAGFFLTQPAMDEAKLHYLGDQDASDPRVSPLLASLPGNLAPAYIATAGFDPLRDEGEAYGTAIQAAGGTATVRRFPGHIHGFLNVVGVGRSPLAAVHEIGDALARGLA